MTIRERLDAFWSWERPDRIPYTIYYGEWRQAGQPADWQPMFDAGLGVTRHCGVHAARCPGLETVTDEYELDGHNYRRITRKTPVGSIYAEWKEGWNHRFWLHSPDDYRVATWIAQHTELTPNYEPYLQLEREGPEWEVPLVAFGRTPLQTILVDYVGLELFAVQCFDYEAELREFYEALLVNCRRLAEIVADGPGRFVSVLENFTAETMGPKRYASWLKPVYEELFPGIQASGKLLGTHYDGLLKSCAAEVATAPMDLLESLTPPPEGDLTLAEAREWFPDKLIWSNLNVALYQLPPAELRQTVHDRVAEAAPDGRGLAFEVSEHWPRNWQESMPVVLDALRETEA